MCFVQLYYKMNISGYPGGERRSLIRHSMTNEQSHSYVRIFKVGADWRPSSSFTIHSSTQKSRGPIESDSLPNILRLWPHGTLPRSPHPFAQGNFPYIKRRTNNKQRRPPSIQPHKPKTHDRPSLIRLSSLLHRPLSPNQPFLP